MHLEDLTKRVNIPHQFLSKETYEALLMTSYSTVACIWYLLTEEPFVFADGKLVRTPFWKTIPKMWTTSRSSAALSRAARASRPAGNRIL
ncbi:hypothetical protein IscW_ISCW001317 [Ixodes scapularis]|uniref:Uncharacterized protein n=1 Tax=Ixodes scapularis TaxID=6945 RepID=B7P3H8_IXOSC|nr:hypothetical protein IscW_ISCW001317 [Ixodes scapularis]|eukprot:XP_002404178.1 hypothetical protein IscW_ISCW001317 [Ixodes scapularis]